jgi:hypothetical protein
MDGEIEVDAEDVAMYESQGWETAPTSSRPSRATSRRRSSTTSTRRPRRHFTSGLTATSPRRSNGSRPAKVGVAVTGLVYRAPLATAAPTTQATSLNVAFVDVGYIGEDGVTQTLPGSR